MLQIPTIRKLFLGLLVLSNLSCAALAPLFSRSAARGQVDLRPCRFPNHSTELLCGKYDVYEDRAAKIGRTITLNILLLPALTPSPAPDPVFFLAGGPGQGAARIARAGEDPLMRELRRERDLVFIDQRGTGDSNRLGCAVAGDRAVLQNYFRDIFQPDTIRSCRRNLEHDADLRLYTTATAIEDMDEIRRALGYDKINLYGVSYGTLSALEYLHRYPDQVRAAVLAGVITPSTKLPLQFAKSVEQAMDRMIEDCAADESCRSAFPSLRADFAAVLGAFAAGPVQFKLAQPGAKTAQPVTLSRDFFTERLRLMLYDHSSTSLLPYLIHRAAQGDWLPFGNVVVRPTPAPAYTLALGTYLTIVCSESVAFMGAQEISEKTAGTFSGNYRVLTYQRACGDWPRGSLRSDFLRPVESAVPVLMLSGDVDPVAPAEFGRDAARHLANSRQVLLRNTPHNFTSPCVRALTVAFVAKGSVDNLDVACAERLRRPRFLTELPERYQR